MRLQKIFPEALADKLVSYGSCQFPTLGFVVERYKQVQAFIPEPFWKIKGILLLPVMMCIHVCIVCCVFEYHWTMWWVLIQFIQYESVSGRNWINKLPFKGCKPLLTMYYKEIILFLSLLVLIYNSSVYWFLYSNTYVWWRNKVWVLLEKVTSNIQVFV